MEHGLGHLPFTEKQITTPTGNWNFKLLQDKIALLQEWLLISKNDSTYPSLFICMQDLYIAGSFFAKDCVVYLSLEGKYLHR